MTSAIQPDGSDVIITQDGVTAVEVGPRFLTPLRRVGAAAVAFAVLFVVGSILITAGWETEAEIQSWYADNANTTRQVVGLFVTALAGIAFIWLMVELRDRLRMAGEHRYSTMALTAGAVFVAALAAGSAALAAVSGSIAFSDTASAPTGVELVRVVDSIGYGAILGFGGFAAAFCVFAASRAAQRADLFPIGITVTGYVAAAALLFSLFWIPFVALPLWALMVGIWGLTTKRS